MTKLSYDKKLWNEREKLYEQWTGNIYSIQSIRQTAREFYRWLACNICIYKLKQSFQHHVNKENSFATALAYMSKKYEGIKLLLNPVKQNNLRIQQLLNCFFRVILVEFKAHTERDFLFSFLKQELHVNRGISQRIMRNLSTLQTHTTFTPV